MPTLLKLLTTTTSRFQKKTGGVEGVTKNTELRKAFEERQTHIGGCMS